MLWNVLLVIRLITVYEKYATFSFSFGKNIQNGNPIWYSRKNTTKIFDTENLDTIQHKKKLNLDNADTTKQKDKTKRTNPHIIQHQNKRNVDNADTKTQKQTQSGHNSTSRQKKTQYKSGHDKTLR